MANAPLLFAGSLILFVSGMLFGGIVMDREVTGKPDHQALHFEMEAPTGVFDIDHNPGVGAVTAAARRGAINDGGGTSIDETLAHLESLIDQPNAVNPAMARLNQLQGKLAALLGAKPAGAGAGAALAYVDQSVDAPVLTADTATGDVPWTTARAQQFMLPRSDNPEYFIGQARKAIGQKAWEDEFMNASTEVALRDGRPLIMCPFALQHAGHGNAQWVTAGITALAYRFNLLPVQPCRKNGKMNTAPFRNFHCVNEKNVEWKGMNDGGGLANLAYQAKLESLRAQGKNMFVSGYFQYYHGFSYANDAVCWAMRPDREAQEAVVSYFEKTVLHNLTDVIDQHTSLVAVHVRRGDYTNAKLKELHGALSVDYYRDAWLMLQAKARLDHPNATANNLVVLVFAASGTLDWCKDNLQFPGAKRVRFVDPNLNGRGPGSDIDLLAISLADYYILANSTFGWWSHFYSECRRKMKDWWFVPWSIKRRKIDRGIFTLPQRWHRARDKEKSITPNFVLSEYLYPNTKKLFEAVDD